MARRRSLGVVAAASYEARQFGVRSAMPMRRAVRLCPDAVFVSPDFTGTGRSSQQVLAILRDVTPLVEPLSLDEAYLDVRENALGEPWASRGESGSGRDPRGNRLTASAGVAPNKFLAKIASGWRKPEAIRFCPAWFGICSGLRQSEAILARNLFGAMPAEAVSCVSSRIEARIALATAVALAGRAGSR